MICGVEDPPKFACGERRRVERVNFKKGRADVLALFLPTKHHWRIDIEMPVALPYNFLIRGEDCRIGETAGLVANGQIRK